MHTGRCLLHTGYMARELRSNRRLNYKQLHESGRDTEGIELLEAYTAAMSAKTPQRGTPGRVVEDGTAAKAPQKGTPRRVVDGTAGLGGADTAKSPIKVASMAELEKEIADLQAKLALANLSAKTDTKVAPKAVSTGYKYVPDDDGAVSTGSKIVSDGDVGGVDGGVVGNTQQAIMVKWLKTQGVSSAVIGKMLDNGCDSMSVLRVLRDGDWDLFGLSLGLKRVIQNALNDCTDLQSPTVKSSCHTRGPAGQPAASVLEGGLDSDLFLGMGVQGEQKDYLDICQFVSVRSPYDALSESDLVVSQTPEGGLKVVPSCGKRVSLEKVSMSQWIEANAQIMSRLLAQGVEARDYLNYTIMVSQLAQKYQWVSVLLYDREYRKLQANSGFRWGRDISHIRDVMLIPKYTPAMGKKSGKNESKPTQGKGTQGGQTGQPKGAQSGVQGNGPSGRGYRRDIAAEGKFKLCRAYNSGTCTWDNCLFRHFCMKCGASDHGGQNCPK